MPALPAHRGLPHAGKSGTAAGSSPYGTTMNPSAKSHHARKKSSREPPSKKNPPMIVDRKQAVYNIGQGIKSGHNSKSSTNSINSADSRDSRRISPPGKETRNRTGVYEPLMVRIEIKGGVVGERKKLEKDPNGRLYEVDGDLIAPGGVIKSTATPGSSLSPVKGEPYSSKADSPRKACDSGQSPYSERSTQEAISRIKRNVERKEEFLMRQSSEGFAFPPRGAMVYRQYQICPQKISPRPIWPPMCDRSTESLDKDSSFSLTEESGIRRPKTVTKANSLDSPSLMDHNTDIRPSSLPASPTTKDEGRFFGSGPTINMPPTTANYPPIKPLVRNSIAKPYGLHIVEDSHAKVSRPYFSTLSRIQENQPATPPKEYNNNIPPDTAVAVTPTASTWVQSHPRFVSDPSTRSVRSIPMAWMAENDRVKQLQIVSTRAKRFEPSNRGGVGRPATKFELARLAQQGVDVSKLKEDFENQGHGVSPKNQLMVDKYGMPTNLEGLLNIAGTRSNPVGGPKIHCEPPHKYRLGLLERERDRSHSVCSHPTLWKDRSTGSDLVRQHSFHSTIRSHIAQPPAGGYNPENPGPSFVLECEEGLASPAEGTDPSFTQRVTRPCLLDLKSHALPASNDPYASYYGAGAVGTLHKASSGPFDDAVTKSDMPHVVEQASVVNDKKSVALRGRIWLGDEHDRLVRRVSYLKATSTDRVLTDSDVESEDERSTRHLSVKRTSAPEDLPSPASFKASIVLHGHLNVKLARHRGKRAGDRSWKSVWGVIRGRALLFYKDKQVALQTPLGPEDQVTLKDAEIGVAIDYTKKKNVLRLNTPVGSQFLLQAESEAAMTAWLTSLKSATAQVSTGSRRDPQTATTPSSSVPLPPTSVPSPVVEPISNTHETSSPYGDPDTLHRNMRSKVTSPRRTRSPTSQAPTIKSRKSTDGGESSLKSKTWKVRIGRHLKKMQAGSTLHSPSTALPHGASIGVCLEDCPPSSENDLIPLLVALCVGVVESKGLHIQGIYRIPGNKAAVNHLIEMVNQGPHAIDLFDSRWSDVNVISSLLKQFLHKLPDPLIPSYMYCQFIDASKCFDQQNQRLIGLKSLVHELPDYHFDTLRYLISHFSRVAAKSNQNRMDIKNLAIVFGPTLVRVADDNVAKMVTDMSHQCRIIESLILHESWFFSEEEMDDPPPVTEENDPSNDTGNISEMEANSQSLLLNNISKLEGNYKETNKIVSSLISAANRIHKNRGKKVDEEHSMDDYHPATPSDSVPTNDRRISGASMTGSLSATTDKISVSSHSLESGEQPKHSTEGGRLKSNSVSMGGSSVGGFAPDSPTRMESTYLGDELAIRSYAGLSARTQERIRQFEMETRAMMLQRDILSRQESQKLESNRKKVEDQLQKAKHDMENEDIFDKMAGNPSEIVPRISDFLAVAACRASNKEPPGGFPSCSITQPPAGPFMPRSLTTSFAVATNASVKVASNSSSLYDNSLSSKLDDLAPTHTSHYSPHGTISSSYNTLCSVHSGISSGYGSLTRSKHANVPDDSVATAILPAYDLASSLSGPDATSFETELARYQSSPHLSAKAHRKAKKASKKRSTSSVSRSARETILKHILPFHSSPKPEPRRSSSAESLIDTAPRPSVAISGHLASPSCNDLTLFKSPHSQSHPGSGGLLALDDNYSINDSREHPTIKKSEGSDLLRDMTETFEEKMRSLQDSQFLTPDSITDPTSNYEQLKRDSYAQGKENAPSTVLDAKCHLYRDPSLHIIRSPVDVDQFYNYSQAIPEIQARGGNLRRTESLSKADRREKDKSEKRSRELHRIDTQDILREKKPKELKRSKTQEIQYPIDLMEKFGYDLKSRKQNVRQLKEKFERSSPETVGDPVKKRKKSRIKRRHTVGGTKDLARVALLRVLEAQKGGHGAPTWQQIQTLVANLTADKRYPNLSVIARDGELPDLNAILSLVVQPSEPLKRHFSVKESTQKSLHPVLESHV